MQNITERILITLLRVLYEKHLSFTISVVFLRYFNIVLQGDKEAERKSPCNAPLFIDESLFLIYLEMRSTIQSIILKLSSCQQKFTLFRFFCRSCMTLAEVIILC